MYAAPGTIHNELYVCMQVVRARAVVSMAVPMNVEQPTFNLPSLDNTTPFTWNASNTTLYYNYSYNDTYDYDYEYEPRPPPSAAIHVAFALVRYLFPVIILIGTTGNAISAAVMLRRRMRATSIYCYLLLLAVVDTIVLFVSAFKTWVRLISGVEWLHGSTASCKTIMFLFLFAIHLSAWLIVVVSADRFVAVWMPLKALTLCTPQRARLLCLAVTSIMVVANLHVFWTIHLIQD